MKKIVASLMAAALVAVILAGCFGNQNAPTQEPEGGSVPVSAEETSEAADGETATESAAPTAVPTATPAPTEAPEPTAEPTPAPPEVSFTDVNETVYASGTVNVRTGPSTDYEKVGQLKRGESVTRTGVGDNNWSRVDSKAASAMCPASI